MRPLQNYYKKASYKKAKEAYELAKKKRNLNNGDYETLTPEIQMVFEWKKMFFEHNVPTKIFDFQTDDIMGENYESVKDRYIMKTPLDIVKKIKVFKNKYIENLGQRALRNLSNIIKVL